MTKSICISICLVFLCINAAAQYEDYKDQYKDHKYERQSNDPYRPFLCGAASFIIPGSGQFLTKEIGRGMAFLGAVGICDGIAAFGVGFSILDFWISAYTQTKSHDLGAYLFLGGLIGAVSIHTWSAINAAKIARIKNIAHQNQTSLNLKLSPIYTPIMINNSKTNTFGLALALSF